MLIGQTVLVPVRDAEQNPLLEPAIVVAQEGPTVTVELAMTRRPIPGERLEVFGHDAAGDFHRTSTLVETVEGAAPSRIRLRVLTPPVRLEHRSATRVDVASRHFCVTIAGQARCRVLDISAAGFAFDAPSRYDPNQRLRVEFNGGEVRALGEVEVRCVRIIGPMYRCGVFVPESETALRAALDLLMWTVLRAASV